MLRIWFNRTYATTCHLIGMLRANPDGRPVHVLGSHADPYSPVPAVCNERFPEPELPADDYVAWALEAARARGVDILVPRLHLAELAAARTDFEAAGVRLLCPDADTVRLFDRKTDGYRAAAELGLPVPPYRVAHDSSALRAAYAEFAAIAAQVCMKPVRGVGGEGYRRLTDARPDLSDFAGEVRSVVRVDDVCAALDAAAATGRPCPELMVMPFLDGREVSVDVLADRDGNVHAAIGRLHSGRYRVIVDDPDAREIAEALTAAHRVAYLSNTQVRYWQAPDDPAPRPYLLELNTRAAGGLFQTALAGVNLPWSAIRLALGEPAEVGTPHFGASYVQVASAVALTGTH